MKIRNIFSFILVISLLISVIPYNSQACFFKEIVSKEVKDAAKKAMDAAKATLDAAIEEQRKINELNNFQRFIVITESFFGEREYPSQEKVNSEGMAEADRKSKDWEAKKKVEAAQANYDMAKAAYDAMQPVEHHVSFLPACGNEAHKINLCDLEEKIISEAYLLTHTILQTRCLSHKYIDGAKVFCSVTDFYLCQDHEHVFPSSNSGSGSGSGR